MICLCLLFIQVAIGVLMSITYTIHRENPHTFDTSALHRVFSKQTKFNPIYSRKLESQKTWVCIIKRGCVSSNVGVYHQTWVCIMCTFYFNEQERYIDIEPVYDIG